MHAWRDEWSMGPLWVRPLNPGRWELGDTGGTADQRNTTVGLIDRADNAFQVTLLSDPQTRSRFGSLLSAIEFVTLTVPTWGDS